MRHILSQRSSWFACAGLLGGLVLASGDAFAQIVRLVGAYQPSPSPPSPTETATGPTQTWQWKGGTSVVEAEITPIGPGRYVGKIGVGAPGCGGAVEGPVVQRGNVYTLVNDDRESGTMCRVVMTVRGRSMTMKETDCGNWHGASCDFGEHPPLTRVR